MHMEVSWNGGTPFNRWMHHGKSMDDLGLPHDLGNLHIIYTLELLFDNFCLGPSGIKHGVIWEPGCFTCRSGLKISQFFRKLPRFTSEFIQQIARKLGKSPLSRYAKS